MRKIISILTVFLLVFGLTACGTKTSTNEGNNEKKDLSDVTIGIVGYSDSGTAYDSIVAVYNQISEATGIKFKYVKGSSFDESVNVTAVQNLISSGCNGIIMTMDSGMASVMKEANAAGVYVAGFLNSMDQSFEKIKDDKYFLGTVSDGYLDGSKIGQKAAELVIRDKKRNVGVITYPHNYFPTHAQADKAFRAAIEEYNNKATETDKINLYESVQLSFKALEPTYFQKNSEIDGIFGMGLTFIYPTMVNSNIENVTLYSTGYDTAESYVKGFESGVIGMETCSNTEALVYPVSLIANAVKGKQFSDKPASAEAVETNTVFLTSEDELNAFQTNAIYHSGDVSHSLLKDEDIKNLMTAINENASYKDLVKTIQSWSIEDIQAKSK